MQQKLGQHFLKNEEAIKKIIASLDLEKGDTIIEIGPGRGALTFPLLETCRKIGCRLIAIEKDKQLADFLKNNEGLEIITGDALKVLPAVVDPAPFLDQQRRRDSIEKRCGVENLWKTHFKVVGNIPYYITGKLLRTLGDLKNRPKIAVLMVQKEVAERISAKPPRMNLLAAAVQFWANPKIVATLKPSDFDPPPEVNSAVIKLRSSQDHRSCEDPKLYYKLTKIIFKQPRKTLLNNLSAELIGKEQALNLLKSLGFNEKTRPQELSVKDILELTKSF